MLESEKVTAPAFLAGGGEMGRLIRAHRWAATPLGPVEGWPRSLRTAVGILLNSGYPMYIAWGPKFVQLYNDAYRPILGSTKHPGALGSSTYETFREIWDFIGPMFRDVLATGKASTFVDQLLPLDRHGYAEECYFTFSYSAIPDDEGGVGGVFVTVLETTERMLRERRLRTLRDVLEMRRQESLADICESAAAVVHGNRLDAPFVLAYVLEESGQARLAGAAGMAAGGALVPERIEPGASALWPLPGMQLGEVARVPLPEPLAEVSPWPEPITEAICVAVAAPGRARPQAALVVGRDPRLAFDRDYEQYLRGVVANIGTVIVEAEALLHEKRRAEALAELDRAKTIFFSDVSHEFRTPLTLMMGPLRQALAVAPPELRENLEVAERNTLRLLKLVNSLLDFSRIEAGRMRADFRPVDLAALTVDLAGNFRSAIESAGLAFEVDCPPLERPVAVDADMWEKIVLNLLSNAFKHTFEGRIAVRLRGREGRVLLEVSDTGVGIPAAELGSVFERFRRVPNARARSHEGSGIGLALVRELAHLHGGTVDAESRENGGSTFRVVIPFERPGDPARDPAGTRLASTSIGARAFVEEAMRWRPAAPAPAEGASEAEPAAAATVLVVDDNADMRDYVRRLLAARWRVEACGDGITALELARNRRPDLIVTDVMMPGIDGFELLARLRAGADTARIPVILLSARAGEDARVEGLQKGADDYLVKPFSARDLVARVENQLERAREAAVARSRAETLARLFDQAPVGIALLSGPEHRIEMVNPAYAEISGRRALVGRTAREAFPELAGQGIFEILDQVRASGEPYVGRSFPLTLERATGPREGAFDFVYQPVVEGGRVEGILVVVHEVTELARARREAEAASHAKDEFLAMLGHELRNPLAPILTALQLMELRGGSAHESERRVIERQVRHLVGLVDDLLDVSRIAQGKIALRPQRIEVAEVARKAIEQATPLLEVRRHRLELDVPESGLVVDADPQRLAQVLTNLLGNAAKYTDPGGEIALSARAEDGRAVMRVRDNGVGIEPDSLQRIFELFYQTRQGPDRSLGGLGLGLAIVRSLVALHGGEVRVASEGRGRGSEFTVAIPLARGEAVASAPPRGAGQSAGKPCRILVVDDNADAAQMLAVLLESRGHEVRCVGDGPAALAEAPRFRPEVAFLDIGLPAMDGYELGARLRELPEHAGLPLVALTGYGQPNDRQRSAEAGFQAHLVKPVGFEEVEETLRNLEAARDLAR